MRYVGSCEGCGLCVCVWVASIDANLCGVSSLRLGAEGVRSSSLRFLFVAPITGSYKPHSDMNQRARSRLGCLDTTYCSLMVWCARSIYRWRMKVRHSYCAPPLTLGGRALVSRSRSRRARRVVFGVRTDLPARAANRDSDQNYMDLPRAYTHTHIYSCMAI